MATDRNPSIVQPQSVGLVAPATTTPLEVAAKGAGQLIQFGGEVYQQHLEDKVADEIRTQSEEGMAALEASFDESLSPEELSAMNSFEERMQAIRDASEQRAAGTTVLQMELEKTLTDHMQTYPRLAARFNRAATGVLGYSPIGARMRALMQQERSRSTGADAMFTRIANESVKLGVDPGLYYSNREEWWNETSRRLRRRQEVTEVEQALAVGAIKDQQQLAGHMANISGEAWDNDVKPLIDEFYTAIGITPNTPMAEQTAAIQSAISSGQIEQVRGQIAQKRAVARAEAYDHYVSNFGQDMQLGGDTVRAAPMDRATFDQMYAPIDAMYQYAMEAVSSPAAMQRIDNFSKLIEAQHYYSLPTELQRAQYIVRMFGPESHFAQKSMRGRVGVELDRLTEMWLLDSAGAEPGPQAQLWTPVVNPDGTYNPKGTHAVRPLPPPEQVNRTQPERSQPVYEGWARTDVDGVANNALAAIQSGDPQSQLMAGATVNAFSRYAAMVVQAKNNGTYKPNPATDMVMVEQLADPKYAEIYAHAFRGYRADRDRNAALNREVLDELMAETTDGIETTIRTGILDPQALWLQGMNRKQLENAGARVPPGFLNHEFRNRISWDIDPDARTITFSARGEQDEITKHVIDRLNSLDGDTVAALVNLTMAATHLKGTNARRAYNQTFAQILRVDRG